MAEPTRGETPASHSPSPASTEAVDPRLDRLDPAMAAFVGRVLAGAPATGGGADPVGTHSAEAGDVDALLRALAERSREMTEALDRTGALDAGPAREAAEMPGPAGPGSALATTAQAGGQGSGQGSVQPGALGSVQAGAPAGPGATARIGAPARDDASPDDAPARAAADGARTADARTADAAADRTGADRTEADRTGAATGAAMAAASPPFQAVTPQLDLFITKVARVEGDLSFLRAQLEAFSDDIQALRDAVEFVDDAGSLADEVRDSIDSQLRTLTITKQAGPLKLPSRIYEDVLKLVRPLPDTVDRVVDAINDIGGRGPSGRPGSGDFLDDLDDALEDAQDRLDAVVEVVGERERGLEDLLQTMRSGKTALDTAAASADAAAFNGLRLAVEAQLAPRNADIVRLEAQYDQVIGAVRDFLALVDRANVVRLLREGVDFTDVAEFIRDIGTPLSAAGDRLEPVQGILDKAGALIDATLNPIFEFIIDTLQLDTLFETISDEIRAQLPSQDFLDGLRDQGQRVLDQLLGFENAAFGLDNYLPNVDLLVYGNSLGRGGPGLSSPTWFGTQDSEVFVAQSQGQLIDPRGGNDTVDAGAGNDIVLASGGDDVVDGGAGIDLIQFSGFFLEYELARLGPANPGTASRQFRGVDAPIVITHVRPGTGELNERSETITNFEYVAFADLVFTGQQLANAFIGGSTLNGSSRNDLMFLNSLGVVNADGQHVANGLSGNDRIFGSTLNDELNGGTGDDTLVGGFGDDEINGGSGRDIFQALASEFGSDGTVDLSTGRASVQGADRLSGIEDIIVQVRGEQLVRGTDADNLIITSDRQDRISGAGGNDRIEAGEGDDYIIGGMGADRLLGDVGRDVLISGSRAVRGVSDFYDGGSEAPRILRPGEQPRVLADVLSYTNDVNVLNNIVRIDNPTDRTEFSQLLVGPTTVSDPGSVRIFGEQGRIERFDAAGNLVTVDTAINIESYVGSDGNDTIYGRAGYAGVGTRIHGGRGDDTLFSEGALSINGGLGSDRLVWTLADDAYSREGFARETPSFNGEDTSGGGSSGIDTLDVTAIGDARWSLDLNRPPSAGTLRAYDASTVGRLGSSAAGSSFTSASVQRIERYELGAFDDRIGLEDGFRISVFAGGGDDLFEIGTGARFSTLFGQDGDDEIIISNGARGATAFFGGAGDDRAYFNEGFRDSDIDMGAGNDVVVLDRYQGARVEGGAGFDTLVIERTDGAATIDLATGDVRAGGSNDSSTRAVGFEAVFATRSADTLLGSGRDDSLHALSGDDTLEGRGGDDRLHGGAGNDTLRGGSGDDVLHGFLGNDRLDGGTGRDAASYTRFDPGTYGLMNGRVERFPDGSVSPAGVTVDLTAGTASGSQGNDTLISIEDVYGSEDDDTITGNAVANLLSGGDGNDRLFGLGGDDVLLLGSGNDLADGGAGDDRIEIGGGGATVRGGGGFDTLGLGGRSGTVSIDFRTDSFTTSFEVGDGTRETGGGTFSGIERVAGGGAVTFITLSRGRDVYEGRFSEDDRLDLRDLPSFTLDLATRASNNPFLRGDILLGIDGVLAGRGNDAIAGTNAAESIAGGGGNDRLTGRGGDDTLIGQLGNDVLNGGDGDDTLLGGGGRDALIGGRGFDVASYAASSRGIVVDFLNRAANTGDAAGDVYNTVEGLEGSRFSDVLAGNNGGNLLLGGNGNDALFGRGGNDRLEGGAGNDRMDGGAGRDLFLGDAGIDLVTYAREGRAVVADLAVAAANRGAAAGDRYADVELLQGTRFGDSLRGDNGANVLFGGNGNDVLFGRGGNDRLLGDNGNDVLYGQGGNDRIEGRAGNDRLEGGAGADTLVGGSGRDVFAYRSASDSGIAASQRDRVADFQSGIDRLDLSAIDANAGLAGNQAFTFIGGRDFSAAGQVRFATGLLMGDTNGDGRADFAIAIGGFAAGDLIL